MIRINQYDDRVVYYFEIFELIKHKKLHKWYSTTKKYLTI